MKYKDILNRALKTFFQGFLASMVMSINNATRVDETVIKSAILGAIAGGISCVMNMIINLLNDENSDIIK